MKTTRTTKLVLAGVFSGLTILLGLVPSVGLIPVPTPAGNATTMHIPAILAGILGGPVVGATVGLFFGIFSFLRPSIPLSPLAAIVVTVIPRIFIGVVAWAAYVGVKRANRNVLTVLAAIIVAIGLWFTWQVHYQNAVLGWIFLVLLLAAGAALFYFLQQGTPQATAVVIAAVCGSFTNTILVLSMAVVMKVLPVQGVILVGITHGIPEAIVAAIITSAVMGAIGISGRKQKSSL